MIHAVAAALVDDVDLLLQYLISADFLGFFIACYTTRIGEMFYSVVLLTVSVVIYLRSGSLAYAVILWIILGSLGFLAAAPAVSVFSVLFISLALIFLIHKLIF